MTKTKYLLYSFCLDEKGKNSYWYETDKKYFKSKKPPKHILSKNTNTKKHLDNSEIFSNPWLEWESNDVQKIISKEGLSINYFKSLDNDFIVKQEDLRLLEVYHYLVEHFDISKSFGLEMIQKWHEMIFENIYPFAGDIRTVNMTKGEGILAWEWRLDFLRALPDFDKFLYEVSKKDYNNKLDEIVGDLSKLVSDFLFIHPFREGNGRVSRLFCDILLAKNGFPMIGLNIKKEDNYIQRIHEGYQCNYEPMKELLKQKVEEELMNL